jgi:hypothetical protein
MLRDKLGNEIEGLEISNGFVVVAEEPAPSGTLSGRRQGSAYELLLRQPRNTWLHEKDFDYSEIKSVHMNSQF